MFFSIILRNVIILFLCFLCFISLPVSFKKIDEDNKLETIFELVSISEIVTHLNCKYAIILKQLIKAIYVFSMKEIFYKRLFLIILVHKNRRNIEILMFLIEINWYRKLNSIIICRRNQYWNILYYLKCHMYSLALFSGIQTFSIISIR